MSRPTPRFVRSFGAACALLLACGVARAQVSYGGAPVSASTALAAEAPTETMPAVDAAALIAEDEAQSGKAVPYRFGTTMPVDFTLDNSGAWEPLSNGDRLWRLRIASPGAFSINLIFENYWLPGGASLFVYNDDRSVVLGSFTEANNETHGQFAIEPVPGEAITLEYLEPANAPAGVLRVGEVIHAYRDLFDKAAFAGRTGQGGPKASGSCNINVNCPLGANFQDVKRSVARLLMGNVLCTGSLINNTADDGTQYFITANHCYSGNPATWVFQFNYESATCVGTSGSPQSVSGAQLQTKSATGDHCLVRITSAIPASYGVYLNGWDRSGIDPTMGTGIHHPQGDIKKICQDTDQVTKASFGGTGCWHISDWEQGVTEGGSSGSPLYDQNKRYVGQLYGGQAACGFLFNDYYGRLDVSWNTTLASFLDPLGTGATAINGHDTTIPPPSSYCTGKLNSTNNIAFTGSTGTPSVASANFRVQCYSAVPNKNGIRFWGSASANLPFQGGTLCVQPPLIRSAVFAFDILGYVDHPVTLQAGEIGQWRYTQFWGRDPQNADGTNVMLSDALQYYVIP